MATIIAPTPATTSQEQWIGQNVPKIDAMEKALGSTQYVGDMHVPGMLHARVLWAGVPHAIIRGIHTAEAEAMPGVRAVSDRRPMCPASTSTAWPSKTSPSSHMARCAPPETPLRWLPPRARSRQRRPWARIKLDLEPLRPILTVDDALDPTAPPVHEGGNLFQHTTVRKGDLERGMAEAVGDLRGHLPDPAHGPRPHGARVRPSLPRPLRRPQHRRWHPVPLPGPSPDRPRSWGCP